MAYRAQILPVIAGGTGLATLTAHAIQLGNATSAPTQLAVGATGTVLAGATGADPAFTATPTVTSITFGSGNALSTYAEGTFTPTLVGASAAGITTYTVQTGTYVRVGNIVTVQIYIAISAATGTGDLTIGALPFTIKNVSNQYAFGSVFWLGSASWPFPTAATSLSALGQPNTTAVTIWAAGTAIAGGNMQMANATLGVGISLTYQI